MFVFNRGGLPRVRTAAKWLVVAYTAAVVLVTSAPRAQAESRTALVIGNSGYGVRPLPNPKNDATLISETLKSVGFDVATVIDGSQAQMKAAVLEFGRKLNTPDSVAVFYYAGHGVQVDGENYLIPVGEDIRDQEEVALNGVNLNDVLKTMERANSRLNLAILDACRDNPFSSRSRSGASGLAEVDAPSGTMIAYATAPGRVALDGTGTNSPYTAALAAAIPAEGAALEEVFRNTRRKVLEVTKNRQTPWEHSSLTGEFYFRVKTAPPEITQREPAVPPPAVDQRLLEFAAWDAIKASTDPTDLQHFAEQYPNSPFSELASMRLAKLKQTEPSPWPSVVIETGSLPDDTEAEGYYEEALKLDGPTATTADILTAASLYTKSANLGLPSAMFAVGRAYDKGRGQVRNVAQAFQWYRAAANAGHSGAMSSLGTMYEYGEGTTPDLAEAFRLYRMAADRGDTNAMCSLGYLFASGKGAARDANEARRWYALAADRNQPRAAYNLALMNMKGEGGRLDLIEAVRLLNGAAAQGHAGALRELAALYDAGRGVTRDPAAAANHFLRAVRAADTKARADILNAPSKLSLPSRQSIQRELTALGYYQGRSHGAFDTATRRAMDRYAARS
jgi:TPR repeat protein